MIRGSIEKKEDTVKLNVSVKGKGKDIIDELVCFISSIDKQVAEKDSSKKDLFIMRVAL